MGVLCACTSRYYYECTLWITLHLEIQFVSLWILWSPISWQHSWHTMCIIRLKINIFLLLSNAGISYRLKYAWNLKLQSQNFLGCLTRAAQEKGHIQKPRHTICQNYKLSVVPCRRAHSNLCETRSNREWCYSENGNHTKIKICSPAQYMSGTSYQGQEYFRHVNPHYFVSSLQTNDCFSHILHETVTVAV
jgi:hypothetical protein